MKGREKNEKNTTRKCWQFKTNRRVFYVAESERKYTVVYNFSYSFRIIFYLSVKSSSAASETSEMDFELI